MQKSSFSAISPSTCRINVSPYGGTPEDRDATAILLTLPMGLVALFTEIPERGKRTKRDYRA